MLIRNAEIWATGAPGICRDVRVGDTRIEAVGALSPRPGERVIDARGAALLPGLHDHHIHLAATAAARASLDCGPPAVCDESALRQALRRAGGSGWLRATGYHESVAGMLRREDLDGWLPERPLRIQHRSGRMWFLNSRALDLLLENAAPPSGLERDAGGWTGRLFDEDAWLRRVLAGSPPDLTALGRDLSRYGVTGVTDMSPNNNAETVAWLASARQDGFAPQVVIAGTRELAEVAMPPGLALGPVKIHLHEAALPDLDAQIALARRAHAQGRGLAIHCTTEVELVFALALLREAGPVRGDRIEHAGIAPDALVAQIAELGLQVVSQPAFIAERGDQYRKGVASEDWPHLYRLRAFRKAGVVLAAGSDAPYGTIDPWAAMRAACTRRTREGHVIGPAESLDPEQALDLFLADPLDLARQRRVEPGAAADLCLLDRPWNEAREQLDGAMVRATISAGRLVHERPVLAHDSIDEPPVTRRAHADTAAR
ncbi:amidohydrolase family protein [Novosphingobium sp. YJ-S2-02]|uniref:Amidohydrolase family protein n=1 Tax=Novosphingobium aureum TaxID=2792964 RepID=A0A931HFV9_9SPHN|nr:amidohydrolase family protein [Novosphingobium aureum]MBH0114614.1 amidohydrolase family protein [Novosphingobium aureum]